MIDNQMTEIEFASEVGMRVVKTGPDSYQFQRINGRGVTTSVAPTTAGVYEMWAQFFKLARELGALREGGEAGGDEMPKSSPASRVA